MRIYSSRAAIVSERVVGVELWFLLLCDLVALDLGHRLSIRLFKHRVV